MRIGRWFRRAQFWWQRDRMAQELREELEAHRLLRQQALERAGDPDAVGGSRRALGGVLLAREEARAVWIFAWLEGLAQDARFALRTLRRRPGLAAAAIVTIALGTGTLGAVLAVADAALFRPAPYPNADRIVQINQVVDGRTPDEVSIADIRALRASCASLSHVTYAWGSRASVLGDGLPDQVERIFTDSHAFAMLGVTPLLGRLPTLADDRPGAPAVVVLGYEVWVKRFGARRDVVGQTLRIDGEPHIVIAVMPPVFKFPGPFWYSGEIWVLRSVPYPSLFPDTRAGNMLAFGLLRDGAPVQQAIQQAQAEADVVAAALDRRYPDRVGHIGLQFTSWASTERSASGPRVFMLITAGGLLFLLVCANVANLLVSHGLDRRPELAARLALGAGRGRLIRQLLTETAVLFVGGGLGGLVIAQWGARLLVSMLSFNIPGVIDATFDIRGAVTGLIVTAAAALIVGLIPAVQAATVPMSALTPGTRDRMPAGAWQRVQGALIASEVALALVLLCGAAVLFDAGRKLARLDPGFNTAGLLQARVSLSPPKYATRDLEIGFYERVLERLRAIPGVSAAAAVEIPPGVGGRTRPAVLLDTDPPATPDVTLRMADIRVVSTGYLEALGIARRAGRFFANVDDTSPTAIVNESFVRRYLQGANPIGRTIRVTFGNVDGLDRMPRTIIGVAGDVKDKSLYEPAPLVIYVPLAQADRLWLLRMSLLVRSSRPDGDIAFEMRRAIAQADPDQAASGVMALGELMRSELSLNRLTLMLLSILSTGAVFLALVGVYGVTAYAARRRLPEIGIRVALGASSSGIIGLLMRAGGRVALWGVAAGSILGVWSIRLLRTVLHGIDHPSPWTFVAAGALLAVAVLAACYVPARRAARADTLAVLRSI